MFCMARDGFVCKLCGGTGALTVHHWIISYNYARMARFAYENGVTLCYGCHIHQVHTYPDWQTVERLRVAMGLPADYPAYLNALAEPKPTVGMLRALYAQRFEPFGLSLFDRELQQTRKKLYVDLPARTCRENVYLAGKKIRVCGASGELIPVEILSVVKRKKFVPDARLIVSLLPDP